MFNYPPKAAFNRTVPKTKIYAHAKASKRIKELFAAQVSEIVWKYKLSPETTNLPARNGINEIEVFEIALKTQDLDLDVLRAMDKAIPFPLVFEIKFDDQIRFAASYKRPSDADTSKWVIESLFITPWQGKDEGRRMNESKSGDLRVKEETFSAPLHNSSFIIHPLPLVLDLAALYEQILRRHIPLPTRAGESLAEHVARFNALEAKRKARMQLEARLAQEKQFNRKVEMNSALRLLASELERLSQP